MRLFNGGEAVPVDQYRRDGEFVRSFPSIAAATKEGFISNKISMCIHGKNHTHMGYVWRRKGEPFDNSPKIQKFR